LILSEGIEIEVEVEVEVEVVTPIEEGSEERVAAFQFGCQPFGTRPGSVVTHK